MGRAAAHPEGDVVDRAEALASRHPELLDEAGSHDLVGLLGGHRRGVPEERRRVRTPEAGREGGRVGEQLPRVRVFRLREHLRTRPLLHDPAVLQHRDPRRPVRGDAEVVRHEQDARAVLALQLVKQIQHAALHRGVEGAGGLVRDEQPRAEGDRGRDEDPLPHPAGELVRILSRAQIGVVQPDAVEQLEHAGVPGTPVAMPVQTQHLGDLHADGAHRVERRRRILRDQPDLRPADAAERPIRPSGDVEVPEPDAPALDPSALRQQAEEGVRRGGLAGARLADEGEGLPLRDGEGEAVHDLAADVRDPQVRRGEDGGC